MTITIAPAIAAGLDAFISSMEPPLDRERAVNSILLDWLTERGFLSGDADVPEAVKWPGERE